jgi:uncharacterized membrane protein
MRTFVSLVIGIILAAVVVGLGVLVAQNGQGEQFTFLDTSLQGDKGWLAAGAVALGFVLAFLVLIPGRLASAWRGWWLGRQTQALEDRLRVLREQYAELQGSHRRLLEEHQRVMEQVLTPVAADRGQVVATARANAAEPLPRTGPIIASASARRPAPAGGPRLRTAGTPLDRLRERITAMRVALAAKLAGLKRTRTSGDAPSNTDQGSTPQGPTAATS